MYVLYDMVPRARSAQSRAGKLSALSPHTPFAPSTLRRTFLRSEFFRGMHPDTRSLILTGCGDSGRDARALEGDSLRAE